MNLKNFKDIKKFILIISILISLVSLLNIIEVFAINCFEYQDNVIWSSNYSNTKESVSNYQWCPKNNCPGSDCFIENLKTYMRVIDLSDDKSGTGYIQISNNKFLSKDEYLREVSSQEINNENLFYNWDCDNNLCSPKDLKFYLEDGGCLSVKVSAGKYTLMDVTKINYIWCWTGPLKEKIEYSEERNEKNIETKTILPWKYLILILLAIFLIVILIFIFLKPNLRLRRKK